jgi:hypothetical protein
MGSGQVSKCVIARQTPNPERTFPVTPIISALLAAGWLALVSFLLWYQRKAQVAHGQALVNARAK